MFENEPKQRAEPGTWWASLRAVMWVIIAVFAVVNFVTTRSDIESGFLYDASAPQIAQVWAEYIAQVVVAVTVGLAATFAGGFKR